jgi:hypothetical protein
MAPKPREFEEASPMGGILDLTLDRVVEVTAGRAYR